MAKIVDLIKYEGNNDVFVYKHPVEDFNLGSQLIVHETQTAVFFYNGKAMESFGPGKYTLETANIPFLKKIVNSVTGGESMFHAEVYFVNMVTQMNLKWGTDSKIRMFDPATGLTLELGACGTFNLRIDDPRKLLIKVVGTEKVLGQCDITGQEGTGYSSATMNGAFRGMLMTKVKSYLPRAIREENINILEVDEHLDEISDFLRKEVNKVFEEYGLFVPELFVTRIMTPDEDPNFKRLKQQHADLYLKVQEQRIRENEALARKNVVQVEAETEAAKVTIAARAQAEAMKATGFAEAEVMRAKGYTYEQETQRQVGVALAENETAGAAGGIASTMAQVGAGIGMAAAVGKTTAEALQGNTPAQPKPVETPVNNEWECPNCHTKNSGKFCGNCGTAKPVMTGEWFCSECGTKNTGKFCSNCGTPRQK